MQVTVYDGDPYEYTIPDTDEVGSPQNYQWDQREDVRNAIGALHTAFTTEMVLSVWFEDECPECCEPRAREDNAWLCVNRLCGMSAPEINEDVETISYVRQASHGHY